VAVSGGVSLGISVADATLSPTMTNRIGTGASLSATGVGSDLTIATRFNNGSNQAGGASAIAKAASGGLASGGGTGASAQSHYNILQSSGSGVTLNAGRDLNIGLAVGNHVDSLANSDTIGLVAAFGGAISSATVDGTATSTFASAGGTVGGSLNALGQSNQLVTSTARAAGGGLLSGQINDASASFTPTLGIDLGSGATTVGGNATVQMLSNTDTTASAIGKQAGGLSIGASTAEATMSPTVFARTGNQQLTAGGAVLVEARHNHDGTNATGQDTVATALASAGSLLLSGTGASASAEAKANVDASVGAGSSLTANGGSVRVLADAANLASGTTTGLGVSGLIGFGISNASAIVGGGTNANLYGGVGDAASVSVVSQGKNTAVAAASAAGAAGLAGASGGSATARSNSAVGAVLGDASVASSTHSGSGAILVDAISSADADATGKAFSFGLAGAVGFMSATSEVSPNVTAEVRGAATVSGNGITVRARHNQNGENSTAVADAAGIGGGVSIGGASADASGAANTRALTSNASSLAAGSKAGVLVQSLANNVVTATGQTDNGSIGYSAGVVSAAARSGGITEATSGADVTGTSLNVLATAYQDADATAKGTVLGLVAAGTGAGVTVTVNPDVRAGLGDGAQIDVTGPVNVIGSASDDGDGTATGEAVTAGLALGLSKATVTMTPAMSLTLGNNVSITTHSANTGDITLQLLHNGASNELGGASATAFAAGGGFASGGGAEANATVTYNIKQTTGSGVTMNSARGVAIETDVGSHADATADARGFGVGGIGGAVSNASIGGSIDATLGAVSGTQALDFMVETTANHLVTAISQASALGLLGAAQLNGATATFSPVINANLGGGGTLNVGRDLIVTAISSADTTANALGIAAGAGISVGGSIASATMSPSISAQTGAETANVARNIVIRAQHNHDGAGATGNDTRAIARASSGGGLFGGVGASATANANANTTAKSGAGSVLTAGGSITIHADAANLANTESSGLSLSALVSFGSSSASSNALGNTTATIDGGSGGSTFVDVRALGRNYSDAKANASGGALGAGVNSASAAAKSGGSVNSGAGNTTSASTVTSSGSINLLALSEADANAQARGLSAGLVGAVGLMAATAEVSPDVTNTVKGTTTLSGQSINVLAQHDQGGQSARAKADTAGISAGVSVAGATSTAKSGADTSVQTQGNATLNGNGGVVTLSAVANNVANADGTATGAGLAAARGAMTASATSNGSTSASGGGKINGAGLDVKATAVQTAFANSSAAAGGLIAASTGAKSISAVTPTISAGIGAGAQIDVNGGVSVEGNATTSSTGIASGVQFAGGVGAGGSVADVDINPTMSTTIGNNASITTHGAKGDVALALKLNNGDAAVGAATATATASAGAAGISASGSDASANVNATLTNNTGSGVQFNTAGNVRFDTLSGLTAVSVGDSLNLALGGAGGVAKSSSGIGGTTNAVTGSINGTVGGDLVINTSSNYIAVATSKAAQGGLLGSFGLNSAAATVAPTLNAGIGGGGSISAGRDVIINNLSTGDANAEADGITVGGGLAVGGSDAQAKVRPVMTTTVGAADVAAGRNFALTASHNANGNGASDGHDATSKATASGGGLGFSGIGANSVSQASADMTTSLGGSGSDLSAATGNFSVTTRSGNIASAEGYGMSVGLIGLGNARADAIAGGSLTNAQNNSYANDNQLTTIAAGTGIAAGGDVAINSTSAQGATTHTTAPTGGLISAASNDASSVVARNINTQMLGSGISAGGNILISSGSSGGADSEANALSIGFVAVGKGASNARVTPTVASSAGGVLNAGGHITIQASHDGTQGATAHSDAASGGLVGVDGAAAYAGSAAVVSAAILNGASVNASGGTEVLSGVADKANASADGQAYGLAAFGATDAGADANSSSSASVGNAQVTGASLTVEATGGGRGNAVAEATSGGLITGNGAAPVVNVNPQINAQLAGGARIDVGGNVTVEASGNAEGDGNAVGYAGGAGAVSISKADINVNPVVVAQVAAGGQVKAGGSVTVQATQGQQVSVGDSSFGSGGVNASTNVITLNGPHGLTTGDTVTYDKGGDANGAVGGLVDGNNYQVIVQSDTAVKLGAVFNANVVDATQDAIKFASEHGFTNGQRVIYHSAGNTAISGLVDGQAYFVRVIDAQTIKLATSQAAATAAPKTFLSGAVDVANDKITLSGHGFSNNQAVTYRTAGAEQFPGSAVEADGDDQITIANHGFNTGDAVKYTLRDLVIESPNKPPVAITGLTADATYYVIRVDANHIKLAANPTDASNGTAIAISNTAESLASGHILTRVGAAPVSGLVSGNTYYVKVLDANTFQLSTTPGGAAIDLTGVGGGKHTIGTEGIELSGAATSGQHQLELDITSSGSGNGQQLLGAGGARSLVGNAIDNGVSSGATSGSVGALIFGDKGSTSNVDIVTQVKALLGDGATISAGGDVTLNAFSAANGAATAGSSGGAFIAVGYSDAFVNTTQTVLATAGNNAQITTSGGSVTLSAMSTQNGTVDANSKGGGFINSSQVSGGAQLNHTTTAGLGDGASIVAAHDVNLTSEARFDGSINGKASSGGLGADSDADMYWRVGSSGNHQTIGVNVGTNASINAGDDINLDATMSRAKSRVTSSAYSAALGANPDAHSNNDMWNDAVVTVNTGATVLSLENIYVHALNTGLDAYTYGNGEADAAGGDTDVDSIVEDRLLAYVNAAAGALFDTHALDVRAEIGSWQVTTRHRQDGAFIDDGDVNDRFDHTLAQKIDFNADARLSSGPAPELLVNAAGNVVTATNVTVQNTASTVIVNDIVNTSVGTAYFRANGAFDPAHGIVDLGSIAGTQSTFTFIHTFNRITLTNESAKDLRINNIAPVNSTAVPTVTLDVDNVTGPATDPTPFEFNIRHSYGATQILINNTSTSAQPDIQLNGTIDNPLGSTQIGSVGGDIVAFNPNSIIRTNLLALSAGGAIGTSSQRVNVELVQSEGRNATMTSLSAGSTYLGIRGLLRDPNVSAFTLSLGDMQAGGVLDLLLREAKLQTTVNGVPPTYQVQVHINAASLGSDLGTTTWIRHFRPDQAGGAIVDFPVGYFGTGNTAIASTTSIGKLSAGTNLSVIADTPAQRMDLFQRNTWIGGSNVTLRTNGDLTLPSTVQAGTGNLSVQSQNNSVYADHLIAGGNATITAALDISNVLASYAHTWLALYQANLLTAGGSVNMTAARDITLPRIVQGGGNVTLLAGAQILSPASIWSQAGDVAITSTTGSVQVDHVVAGSDVSITARQGTISNVTGGQTGNRLNLYADNLITAGDSITLLAGGDITLPRLVLAFSGPISITSTGGSVLLAQVEADNNNVTISANAGAITEIGSDAAADILGITLHLTAGTGIGTLANAIEIDSSRPSHGTVFAQADGSVFLTEVAGDLNLDMVKSTGADVVLTVQAGDLLDDFADLAADVVGNNLTMTVSGSIGSYYNDVEIDSRFSAAGGFVDASAGNAIQLTEVVQALYVGTIIGTAGQVRLTTRDSAADGEDIIVGEGRKVQAGGAVTLDAGDDLLINGTVTAGDRLFMAVDWHSADAGGGHATVGGTVTGDRPELSGGEQGDVLDVSAQAQAWTVYGNGGDDTILGGAGDDDLYGGEGADNIAGNGGDDLIVAGNGGGGTLSGGAGNDRIFGSDGDDTISGGDGADQIWALAGNDVIDAGAGDDFVDAGDGNDTVYGGAGADTLYGGRGNDTIYGHYASGLAAQPADDNASDFIYGEQGDDELHGNGGDDYIDGGFGADRIFGEAGNDELHQGYGQGGSIDGGDGDDLLVGSDDGADTLLGGAGNDRLQGLAGNDQLNGGDGQDVLEGGAGDDLLEGGAGADLMVGGAGNDRLYGQSVSGAGDDNAADYLYGDFGTNGNEAGSGRDQLFGQGGNDLLYGEGGDDLIQGAAGMAVTETGGGTSNLIDFGGGGDDASFTGTVTPTPAPTPVAVDDTSPRAVGVLPDGVAGAGRWADLGGSAADVQRGLAGDVGLSLDPAVAAGAAGQQYVAWSDSRNGNLEIYVARWDGANWTMLGGSAQQGGVSASTNAGSTKPSIIVDGTGAPVVSWTETNAAGSHDIMASRWNGSAWVSLGNATGTGTAVQGWLVSTTNGPALVWTDDATGNLRIYARIYTGGAWATLGSQAAMTGTGLAVGTEVQDVSVASDGSKVAVAYTAIQPNTALRQVYITEFTPQAGGTAGTGTWAGIAGSASGSGVSGMAAVSTALGLPTTWHADPSIAYFGGSLFVAWQAFSDTGATILTAQLDAGGLAVRDVIKDLSRPGTPQLAAGGASLR
ncbi:calcium-binding protein, partial [Pelomonas sp. KK5]|uniref:beta strand repeat-containing protein n=1 Tax=Pelomonas sp. KK5 TaxID=1855730 RepID=UPI00097BE19E